MTKGRKKANTERHQPYGSIGKENDTLQLFRVEKVVKGPNGTLVPGIKVRVGIKAARKEK